MEENDVKEMISEAFFRMLMAKNRCIVSKPNTDYGVDLIVNSMTPYTEQNGSVSYLPSGLILEIQMKCTTEKQIKRLENGNFIYKLRIKNFNDLVRRRDSTVITKLILVLFVLPELEEDWLEILDDQVKLCKHGYWFYPSADYSGDMTSNKSKDSKIAIEFESKNHLGLDFKSVFNHFYEV